jgi:phosphatidylinositol glycan class K
MTGHGGDGFLKFQDSEEITNIELADAFEQVYIITEQSYKKLYVIDSKESKPSNYRKIIKITAVHRMNRSRTFHLCKAILIKLLTRTVYSCLNLKQL